MHIHAHIRYIVPQGARLVRKIYIYIFIFFYLTHVLKTINVVVDVQLALRDCLSAIVFIVEWHTLQHSNDLYTGLLVCLEMRRYATVF